jgi:hypothetical protein
MKSTDVQPNEFNPFYGKYIQKVPKTQELKSGFELAKTSIIDFFKSIPEDKLEYRYADGKWTIKEVFQHIIDNERIMMYRCFRIARRDKTALAGYEQDDYIMPSKANQKSIDALIEEYRLVRENSINLLYSLSAQDLEFIGISSGSDMSARATAFITLGHEIWHVDIIKSRYL